MNRQNEWTQPPDCNPGAETAEQVEAAIEFRVVNILRSAISETARLAPQSERKQQAILLLEQATELLQIQFKEEAEKRIRGNSMT